MVHCLHILYPFSICNVETVYLGDMVEMWISKPCVFFVDCQNCDLNHWIVWFYGLDQLQRVSSEPVCIVELGRPRKNGQLLLVDPRLPSQLKTSHTEKPIQVNSTLMEANHSWEPFSISAELNINLLTHADKGDALKEIIHMLYGTLSLPVERQL